MLRYGFIILFFITYSVIFLSYDAFSSSSEKNSSQSASQSTAQSGLPLPRFVSLKNDETNLRTGPGTRYPILWVFKRANLPVQIIDEFDMWRKITDHEGTAGWVHHTMLSGKRYAIIISKEPALMRIDSEETAKPLFKAASGVTGAIKECTKQWCRIQISGRKAWIKKDYIWGVDKNEQFD